MTGFCWQTLAADLSSLELFGIAIFFLDGVQIFVHDCKYGFCSSFDRSKDMI